MTTSTPITAANHTRTSGVAFGKELDLEVTDDETSVFDFDVVGERAVDGIVLQLIRGVIEGQKGVVDGDDGRVGIVQGGTEHQTTDTAESVDSKSDGHGLVVEKVVVGCRETTSQKRI